MVLNLITNHLLDFQIVFEHFGALDIKVLKCHVYLKTEKNINIEKTFK